MTYHIADNLKLAFSLPTTEDYKKIYTIEQISPNNLLRKEIKKHISESTEIPISDSTVINFYIAENEDCWTYIFIVFPDDLSLENANYVFMPGEDTEKQQALLKQLTNNFANIWHSLSKVPSNIISTGIDAFLLSGGTLEVYLHKQTDTIHTFFRIA